MDEIVNRVAANQKLVIFNLGNFAPTEKILSVDIKNWLFEGLILREKEFRVTLKNHNWETYKGINVALHCSTDAIVPSWAYLLIVSHLLPYAKKTYKGTTEQLYELLFREALDNVDYSLFKNKVVIIKGCSVKLVPENVYICALEKLQPIAKKIMYGEACSAVPIYKKIN